MVSVNENGAKGELGFRTQATDLGFSSVGGLGSVINGRPTAQFRVKDPDHRLGV